MPLEWRSNSAQTFVQGRLTKIQGYWSAQKLVWDIFDMIQDWDLWDVAFGGQGQTIKNKYKSFRSGPSLLEGLASKAAKAAASVVGAAQAERLPGKELFDALEQEVIGPLQKLLDQTSLTINFKAPDWFGSRAGFDEYITMWDRKPNDGDLQDDPVNPPHVRAKADRWALYGQFTDGKTEVRSNLNMPFVKKEGGATAAPTFNYALTKPPMVGVDTQVFSALNYGRREHGSSTRYGKSFFELSNDYKADAIYFAMDTFTPVSNGIGPIAKSQRSHLYQINAGSFGGAILLAIRSQCNPPHDHRKKHSIELVNALFEAARQGKSLPDTDDNHLLIEAHVFRRVKMDSTCIKRVSISGSEIANDATKDNARSFGLQKRIPVSFVS